jgi:hypothetical protein
MKFIVSVLLTALLAFASGLYFPWWMISVAAFSVALAVPQVPYKAFMGGFFGLFLLWMLIILNINGSNEGVLALRVSTVMGLGNSFLLVILSSLAGALTGGLAALTGSLLRKIIYPKS